MVFRGGMISYLRQVGKCCGGRVCLGNDHCDDDGGGEGALWGVGYVSEECQSAPRVVGLR